MAEPPQSALARSRRDPEAFAAFYAEEAPRMVGDRLREPDPPTGDIAYGG